MNWSAYEYDAIGRKTKETNSKDIVSETEYDELGRVERSTVTGPGGISQETINTYDEAGRVKSTSYQTEEGQKRFTIYEYDAQGRLKRTYYDCASNNAPSAIYTEVVYNQVTGQRVEERDEEGIVTSYHYDDGGAVDKITLATTTSLASEFRFDTDNFGNQTKITNPLGSVREKVYDEKGRLKFEFGPVCLQSTSTLYNKCQAVEYTYFASGQLQSKSEGIAPAGSQTISASRTTKYIYDPVTDQLLSRDFGNNVRDEYSYTDDGRLKRVDRWTTTSAASAEVALTHSRAFTYDPRTGQVATVTSPEGLIHYAYHDDGSLASIKTSAGYDVAYTYDARGNIQTVSGKSVGGTVTYSYDGKTGRKTQVSRPNGVTTGYVYDTRGFLQSITDANGGTFVLTQTYTRDNRGLVKTLTETHHGEAPTEWKYTYDDLKRLAKAEAIGQTEAIYEYTYDKAGNRRSKTVDNDQPTVYSYNSLDQLIDEAGPSGYKTYVYDVYGNLAREYDGAVDNDPEKTYIWDQENKLKTVVVAGPAGKTYTYRYDADGTRVSREISGSSTSPENGITNYLSDYTNPSGYSQALQESDEEGEGHAYVWSGEGLLAQSGISAESSEETRFSHTDHLGTIKQFTAAGGATVGAGLKYSPFGELTAGASDATSYRFTGQYAEDGLGLQYHRARWLDTAKAGWMGHDPVWDFPENFGNSYIYAGQCPVHLSDKTGMFNAVEIGGISGFIGTLTGAAFSINHSLLTGGQDIYGSAGAFGKGFLMGFFLSLAVLVPPLRSFLFKTLSLGSRRGLFSLGVKPVSALLLLAAPWIISDVLEWNADINSEMLGSRKTQVKAAIDFLQGIDMKVAGKLSKMLASGGIRYSNSVGEIPIARLFTETGNTVFAYTAGPETMVLFRSFFDLSPRYMAWVLYHEYWHTVQGLGDSLNREMIPFEKQFEIASAFGINLSSTPANSSDADVRWAVIWAQEACGTKYQTDPLVKYAIYGQ